MLHRQGANKYTVDLEIEGGGMVHRAPTVQHFSHIRNQSRSGWECGLSFYVQLRQRRRMSYGLLLIASQSDTLSEKSDTSLDYTAMSIPRTMRGWMVHPS